MNRYRDAYSMLLTKGVIRVGLSVPATAEFELLAVDDPYGYAGRNANGNELSLFRRPLPATNLDFLSTVMWDGRETLEKGSPTAIHFDLADQSNAATQGHAQRPTPLDEATRDEIVAYEVGNYTAQIVDRSAGDLGAAGREAHGGGSSNAGSRARYQRHLAVESHGVFPRGSIRNRRHPRVKARLVDSEGGRPLPNLPPEADCAGEARARSGKNHPSCPSSPSYTKPFSFHLPWMRLLAATASLRASSGVAEPLAALANMTLRTHVL